MRLKKQIELKVTLLASNNTSVFPIERLLCDASNVNVTQPSLLSMISECRASRG